MAGSRLSPRRTYLNRYVGLAAFLLLATTLLGCVRPGPQAAQFGRSTPESPLRTGQQGDDSPDSSLSRNNNGAEENTSTPGQHVVQVGETLGTIADQYGTSAETLITYNNIEDSDLILPGQVLGIPPAGSDDADPIEIPVSANAELFADHELVYGPDAANFDLRKFVRSYSGYLLEYEEEVEGQVLDGPGIVQLVADRHSVNPRLLLAVLEYHAGWLTERDPGEIDYMLGRSEEGSEGLYKQLSWAANRLNWGFYGRADGGMTMFTIGGDIEATFPAAISDGTAGAQRYLAARDGVTYQEWLEDAGPDGLAATYRELFGEASNGADSPLVPEDLEQPALLLPWESGETWYFTGGPHGGWNSGSAWAALDFVPSEVDYGCVPSDSWVTAVADGIVARSGFGAVVLDLDGDGYAGSGWAITYMHLDNRQRIASGVRVSAGDRLGHPGCEGGVTNGTHVHIARTYNGRWISADGSLPFNLAGWISGGSGSEYNGWLTRDDETKIADVYHTESNAITAD